MKLKKLAKWASGRLNAPGEVKIKQIVTDSRDASKDSLFFCLRGKKVDGHEFIGEVKRKGGYTIGESKKCDITVDSTPEALISSASQYRSLLDIQVIAVTGSSGKTTTTGMTASVLNNEEKTCLTPKSFNTLIGVSQAILNFSPDCSNAVIEMGANHPGEINRLCRLARPTCGIITNVGDAHIGFFGSRENLINTKFELAEFLCPGGFLIYNFDQKNIRQKAQNYDIQKIGFGFKKGADVQGKDISLSEDEVAFSWSNQRIKIKCPGSFNVLNALAAISVGLLFNIRKSNIKKGLELYIPPPHRMDKKKIKGIEIIDDSYNASPSSVKELFCEILKIYPQKDIIAIVGRMRELGKQSEESHREIGKFLAELDNISYILASGKYSSSLLGEAARAGFDEGKLFKFSSPDEGAQIIKKIAGKNSLVVLKGSRLENLEKVTKKL